MAKITEGYMPFMGYQTYYRIVGEEYKDNGKAPLICLHGGPGSTHNYYEVLDNVADDDQRMIVMYDQIGCGNSYLDGHPELWNKEVWMKELFTLREYLGLDTCHIIGQSWGGMMQICYGIDYKEELHYLERSSVKQPLGERGPAPHQDDASGHAGCHQPRT